MTQTSTSLNDITTTRQLGPGERLKFVLLANATSSFAFGVLAVAATGWVTDRLGLDSGTATAWTRIVGAGLIVFALAVAAVALELRGCRQQRGALAVSAADISWVVATAVVIGTVDLSGLGVVLAVVIGVAVLDFAILQVRYARRMATVS